MSAEMNENDNVVLNAGNGRLTLLTNEASAFGFERDSHLEMWNRVLEKACEAVPALRAELDALAPGHGWQEACPPVDTPDAYAALTAGFLERLWQVQPDLLAEEPLPYIAAVAVNQLGGPTTCRAFAEFVGIVPCSLAWLTAFFWLVTPAEVELDIAVVPDLDIALRVAGGCVWHDLAQSPLKWVVPRRPQAASTDELAVLLASSGRRTAVELFLTDAEAREAAEVRAEQHRGTGGEVAADEENEEDDGAGVGGVRPRRAPPAIPADVGEACVLPVFSHAAVGAYNQQDGTGEGGDRGRVTEGDAPSEANSRILLFVLEQDVRAVRVPHVVYDPATLQQTPLPASRTTRASGLSRRQRRALDPAAGPGPSRGRGDDESPPLEFEADASAFEESLQYAARCLGDADDVFRRSPVYTQPSQELLRSAVTFESLTEPAALLQELYQRFDERSHERPLVLLPQRRMTLAELGRARVVEQLDAVRCLLTGPDATTHIGRNLELVPGVQHGRRQVYLPHSAVYLWCVPARGQDACYRQLLPDKCAHVGLFRVSQNPFGDMPLDLYFPLARAVSDPRSADEGFTRTVAAAAASGTDSTEGEMRATASRAALQPTTRFGQSRLTEATLQRAVLPALSDVVQRVAHSEVDATRLTQTVQFAIDNDAFGALPTAGRLRTRWAPATCSPETGSRLYRGLYEGLTHGPYRRDETGSMFLLGQAFGQKRWITGPDGWDLCAADLMMTFSRPFLDSAVTVDLALEITSPDHVLLLDGPKLQQVLQELRDASTAAPHPAAAGQRGPLPWATWCALGMQHLLACAVLDLQTAPGDLGGDAAGPPPQLGEARLGGSATPLRRVAVYNPLLKQAGQGEESLRAADIANSIFGLLSVESLARYICANRDRFKLFRATLRHSVGSSDTTGAEGDGNTAAGSGAGIPRSEGAAAAGQRTGRPYDSQRARAGGRGVSDTSQRPDHHQQQQQQQMDVSRLLDALLDDRNELIDRALTSVLLGSPAAALGTLRVEALVGTATLVQGHSALLALTARLIEAGAVVMVPIDQFRSFASQLLTWSNTAAELEAAAIQHSLSGAFQQQQQQQQQQPHPAEAVPEARRAHIPAAESLLRATVDSMKMLVAEGRLQWVLSPFTGFRAALEQEMLARNLVVLPAGAVQREPVPEAEVVLDDALQREVRQLARAAQGWPIPPPGAHEGGNDGERELDDLLEEEVQHSRPYRLVLCMTAEQVQRSVDEVWLPHRARTAVRDSRDVGVVLALVRFDRAAHEALNAVSARLTQGRASGGAGPGPAELGPVEWLAAVADRVAEPLLHLLHAELLAALQRSTQVNVQRAAQTIIGLGQRAADTFTGRTVLRDLVPRKPDGALQELAGTTVREWIEGLLTGRLHFRTETNPRGGHLCAMACAAATIAAHVQAAAARFVRPAAAPAPEPAAALATTGGPGTVSPSVPAGFATDLVSVAAALAAACEVQAVRLGVLQTVPNASKTATWRAGTVQFVAARFSSEPVVARVLAQTAPIGRVGTAALLNRVAPNLVVGGLTVAALHARAPSAVRTAGLQMVTAAQPPAADGPGPLAPDARPTTTAAGSGTGAAAAAGPGGALSRRTAEDAEFSRSAELAKRVRLQVLSAAEGTAATLEGIRTPPGGVPLVPGGLAPIDIHALGILWPDEEIRRLFDGGYRALALAALPSLPQSASRHADDRGSVNGAAPVLVRGESGRRRGLQRALPDVVYVLFRAFAVLPPTHLPDFHSTSTRDTNNVFLVHPFCCVFDPFAPGGGSYIANLQRASFASAKSEQARVAERTRGEVLDYLRREWSYDPSDVRPFWCRLLNNAVEWLVHCRLYSQRA